MTISNTIRTAGPFIGNGITTAFPFTFKVFKKEEVLAVQTDVVTGIASPLVLNSGYSVTLNADQNANPGGMATTVLPLAVGQTLVLTSDLAYLQPLDITNGGGFYPAVLNAAFDRLTIFCQQLFSLANRSIKFPLSDTGISTELPSAVARAGKILSFDANGNPIVVVPASGSIGDFVNTLSGTGGAAITGTIAAGAGATPTTVQEKLRQEISIIDFIVGAADKAAVLSGTSTVDHTAMVLAAITAAGSTRRLVFKGRVNTGLISCALDDIDWYMEVSAEMRLLPAAYGTSNHHITLTGNRIRLGNFNGNGNQASMTAGQGCHGLLVTGLSPTIIDPDFKNYNGVGFDCNSKNVPGVRRGLIRGGHFDDNAGLGMQTIAASYVSFFETTFDRNGYGFQGSRAGGWTNYADTTHAFDAFGSAVRLRSHHIDFFGCQWRDNARDGGNVNQGSYSIRHIGCLAHGNDDGGFTMAADDTFTGLPGESESCYDISYIDCESYNNFTSGIVAYQPVNGLQIIGGRQYNNGRVSGNLAFAAAYNNGVYIAGGSTGVDIDTKCYDDRQSRVISAVAGSVLTATGWVSGTKMYYPKVAIYAGSDQSLRGYATITAESAGSVTIAPTANNGVTLASIVVGDYVTQAVQHTGVSFGNNCQGQARVTGGGYRVGPDVNISGRKIVSGGFASGQNIILPDERRGSIQLLTNPSWDIDIDTGWTYLLTGGGTKLYDTTSPQRKSVGSLKLTAGSANVYGAGTIVAGGLQGMLGEFIEYGVWSYAFSRGDAYIQLFWFIGASTFSTVQSHPGGGWKFLKIGAQIPPNATAVETRVGVVANKSAWFDNGNLYAIEESMDPKEYQMVSRNLPL